MLPRPPTEAPQTVVSVASHRIAFLPNSQLRNGLGKYQYAQSCRQAIRPRQTTADHQLARCKRRVLLGIVITLRYNIFMTYLKIALTEIGPLTEGDACGGLAAVADFPIVQRPEAMSQLSVRALDTP